MCVKARWTVLTSFRGTPTPLFVYMPENIIVGLLSPYVVVKTQRKVWHDLDDFVCIVISHTDAVTSVLFAEDDSIISCGDDRTIMVGDSVLTSFCCTYYPFSASVYVPLLMKRELNVMLF